MRRHHGLKKSYAALLNGTSQYFSKTSPSKMDLNGAEKLTNGTYESNVTGWAATRGAVVYETTTKHTGNGSAKLTADGTPPNASISNTTIPSDVTTNKVMMEAWVFAPVANTS